MELELQEFSALVERLNRRYFGPREDFETIKAPLIESEVFAESLLLPNQATSDPPARHESQPPPVDVRDEAQNETSPESSRRSCFACCHCFRSSKNRVVPFSAIN